VHPADRREIFSRQRALRCKHRRDRIFRTAERSAESVTDRLEDVTVMLGDRGAHALVVAADRD
jgi:hypothetical protein